MASTRQALSWLRQGVPVRLNAGGIRVSGEYAQPDKVTHIAKVLPVPNGISRWGLVVLKESLSTTDGTYISVWFIERA